MSTLTDLLGIEQPIIQAPMAGVPESALAIAVSNAGALGSLACALLSLESMRGELDAITTGTARPFNVNFFCHTRCRGDGAGRRRRSGWHGVHAVP